MIYALATALALALLAAGYLGWRLFGASTDLKRLKHERHAWQQDKVIRQNLQQMIDGRNAEIKRLRARLRKSEAEKADMEKQASELNLNLFHESGLRILREKEEGARRMKLELMEKQTEDLNRKLKEQKAEALADEARLSRIIADQQAQIERLNGVNAQQQARIEELNGVNADQQAQIEKLTASQARRAPRRAHTDLPNQMTLSDLLGDGRD